MSLFLFGLAWFLAGLSVSIGLVLIFGAWMQHQIHQTEQRVRA